MKKKAKINKKNTQKSSLVKKIDNKNIKSSVNMSDFGVIVENIIERNTIRPYPDINDIPN